MDIPASSCIEPDETGVITEVLRFRSSDNTRKASDVERGDEYYVRWESVRLLIVCEK